MSSTQKLWWRIIAGKSLPTLPQRPASTTNASKPTIYYTNHREVSEAEKVRRKCDKEKAQKKEAEITLPVRGWLLSDPPKHHVLSVFNSSLVLYLSASVRIFVFVLMREISLPESNRAFIRQSGIDAIVKINPYLLRFTPCDIIYRRHFPVRYFCSELQ